MTIFKKILSCFIYVLLTPFMLFIRIRKNSIKKRILEGGFNNQSAGYFYALKDLAWDKFEESDFVLSEKFAKQLIQSIEIKDEFPGKSALLASSYTLLGLMALTNNIQKANHYLLKTASLLMFPKTKDLILAQKLLNLDEYDTVEMFLKRYINNINSLETPQFIQKYVSSQIKQLESYSKEIKNVNKPLLIIKRVK